MNTKLLEHPHNHPNPTQAYTGENDYYTPDTQLQCGCGNMVFSIYQGSYLTVAKCTMCKYEYCIHEG